MRFLMHLKNFLHSYQVSFWIIFPLNYMALNDMRCLVKLSLSRKRYLKLHASKYR